MSTTEYIGALSISSLVSGSAVLGTDLIAKQGTHYKFQHQATKVFPEHMHSLLIMSLEVVSSEAPACRGVARLSSVDTLAPFS